MQSARRQYPLSPSIHLCLSGCACFLIRPQLLTRLIPRPLGGTSRRPREVPLSYYVRSPHVRPSTPPPAGGTTARGAVTTVTGANQWLVS
jgi:hypothetical protein